MGYFSFSGRLSCLAGTLGLCGLVLTGEVVQGVTCPAILTDDGTTVVLSRLPSQFNPGDRVTVTGSGYAGSSTCQQVVLVVTGVQAGE